MPLWANALPFIVICELKLALLSTNALIWYKSSIFRSIWPWNLTDDLQSNREGTSSMLLEATCFISRPFVKSNYLSNQRRFLWGVTKSQSRLGSTIMNVSTKFEIGPPSSLSGNAWDYYSGLRKCTKTARPIRGPEMTRTHDQNFFRSSEYLNECIHQV